MLITVLIDVLFMRVSKMFLNTYSNGANVRQRVVNMWRKKVKLNWDIQSHLKEEDITVSKTSLCLLIKKYKETGTVADRP